jgi:hypothetical protein
LCQQQPLGTGIANRRAARRAPRLQQRTTEHVSTIANLEEFKALVRPANGRPGGPEPDHPHRIRDG